jgi:pantoate--beta-alanine ligase
MTMGALHDGHLSLVRHARTVAPHVVVTVFVNPLQFGAGEDLDRYPRDLPGDLAALAPLLADDDVVLAPSAREMYPDGPPRVRLSAGPVGDVLEGEVRPGHFDGMLTVVLKLLHRTAPHVAVFGAKDAQQVALVRAMVRDLDVPVAVVEAPTVREPDGLARSSRNAYLSPADRQRATGLWRALVAGRAAAADETRPCTTNGSATQSAMVISGLKLVAGSWNTNPIRGRIGRSSRSRTPFISTPSTSSDPPVTLVSPATARPIVVLPEPDSPTRPSTSPGRITKSTPSTARNPGVRSRPG